MGLPRIHGARSEIIVGLRLVMGIVHQFVRQAIYVGPTPHDRRVHEITSAHGVLWQNA